LKLKSKSNLVAIIAGLCACVALPATAAPVPAPKADAKAALALVKKEKCVKCHDPVEKKEAKSFTEISKKYKTKPDAPEKIRHHMTSGEKVKLDDGSEEEHKIIKTKDEGEIQNVIAWIRSLAK
jgi:cytochrome c